ncbi:hypothetical protein BCF44_13724 [Kutzneria buriramensis]|uniref:Uncharacterized protein n=1 Tax=Kutzneria buriramensis TaxID=1045776 RepID=A0A3E0G7A0_9PSEU|nr:hypothetical protein BCF44_13724 [Kutzneria buriramensis]
MARVDLVSGFSDDPDVIRAVTERAPVVRPIRDSLA